jgi:hypothetical protein
MKRAIVISLLIAVALIAVLYSWRESNAGIYKTYSSPDGRYRVEVWRYPEMYAAPGDSGGAPGFVRLVDTESGKTIERKATEMVMVIDSVRWSSDSVAVKLFVDWSLPK